MADSISSTSSKEETTGRRAGEYVVVARRYRPQVFDELIGQEHVARALSNAISTARVGHAYLFTGARGVGKTSAARILSKALNCVNGPAPTPCNRCDICLSIATGDDVDVLEIDGASNRGIDEIRQLRQNVNVRPSRARFKIYIIDEVHMLTREAFNALLKTLEEPPEHVKFIFCTTEPAKIPITILSRCQRFDFAGIVTGSIAKRLRQIVDTEGVEAEADALEVLARRAAGSMRDAQSLLEQLLAFAAERITASDVHAMLGTAGDERLAALVDHVARRDAAAALAELDAAAGEGVDVGQLLEQLFGYLRDCMAAAVGCPPETFLYAPPGSQDTVIEVGRRLGLETVTAAMQILDQTLSRLRYSTQGRILAELALVRLCGLEELTALPAVIASLQQSVPAAPVASSSATTTARSTTADRPATPVHREKRSNSTAGTATDGPAPPKEANAPRLSLSKENAAEVWSRALAQVSGMAAEQAKHFDRLSTPASNHLVVSFKPGYTLAKSYCERPEQFAKLEAAVAEVTGESIKLEFALTESESDRDRPERVGRAVTPHQRILEISQHPMIHQAEELFGAHPIRVDDPPSRVRETHQPDKNT